MNERPRTKDVKAQPAYTIAEAARYLSMPPATLRSWFTGIEQQHFEPVLRWEDPSVRRLSFRNLVEAHVLRAIRTRHSVSMHRVREAMTWVEQEQHIPRLLLHPGLRTALGRLFLEHYSQLTEMPPGDQLLIARYLERYLEAVVQDPKGVPIRLHPWIPDPSTGPKKSIVIDPTVAFGHPVTTVRGIRTAVLADQIDAGASISDLAADYAIEAKSIEDALAFERAAA